MASLARSVGPFLRPLPTNNPQICAQCRRSFLTSRTLQSGHNKWSKIKHEKAAADHKKQSLRESFVREITNISKLYGSNLSMNPQLAALVERAKKANIPKAVLDGAIARGQGRSPTGAPLESMTFEAMMPPSTAIVVEVETESRTRILQDLPLMVKKAKGTTGASKFFFTRVGRVRFEGSEGGADIDQIMDDAIEAGAEDLENDAEGTIVVWTEPSRTMQVAQAINSKFGLKVLDADILWSPNEDTKATLNSSQDLINLTELLGNLREYPDVRAIYSNATKGAMSDEEWEKVEQHLDT